MKGHYSLMDYEEFYVKLYFFLHEKPENIGVVLFICNINM